MYCDLWWQYIQVRKLFKGGNYSRAETIRGNTVFDFQSIYFGNGKQLAMHNAYNFPHAQGEDFQKKANFHSLQKSCHLVTLIKIHKHWIYLCTDLFANKVGSYCYSTQSQFNHYLMAKKQIRYVINGPSVFVNVFYFVYLLNVIFYQTSTSKCGESKSINFPQEWASWHSNVGNSIICIKMYTC